MATLVRGALPGARHCFFVGLLAVAMAVVSVVALPLMPRKAEPLEF